MEEPASMDDLALPAACRLGDPLPQRVILIRALPGLGDLLCAVPAWRALRAALPRAHSALVGLPGAGSFGARSPQSRDEGLEFPGYPGIPEPPLAPPQILAFLARIQARGFDL